MSLIINGTVKGKSFEDKQISAKEVLELFGLKERFKRLDKTLRFDVVERKTKRSNGQIQHPERVAIMCITQATVDGDSFELIYYKTRVRKDSKGGKTYYDMNPRKVYIEGGSLPINTDQDLDLAVFLYLHSQNETSPVRIPSTRANFKLHDGAAQAENIFRENSIIFQITNSILKDDVNALRLKAQGLRLGNFANKDEMTVRSALLERFNKAKAEGKISKFIEDFNNPASMFTGIILEAVARGIITTKPDKGQYIYVWGANTKEKGSVVCRVLKGETPIEYLIKYAQNNYEYFMKTLEKEILNDQKRHGLESADEEIEGLAQALSASSFGKTDPLEGSSAHKVDMKTLVEAAVHYGVIEYSRRDNAIFNLKGDEYAGDALFQATQKDWKTEYANWLEETANNEAAKKLKSQVNLAVNRGSGAGKKELNLMKTEE
jgi:hypothetical protein